jgi:hypothetical protein
MSCLSEDRNLNFHVIFIDVSKSVENNCAKSNSYLSVNCDVKYFLDPVLCFLGPKSKISTTEPVPVNYF